MEAERGVYIADTRRRDGMSYVCFIKENYINASNKLKIIGNKNC